MYIVLLSVLLVLTKTKNGYIKTEDLLKQIILTPIFVMLLTFLLKAETNLYVMFPKWFMATNLLMVAT
jgi:hypothetical protein